MHACVRTHMCVWVKGNWIAHLYWAPMHKHKSALASRWKRLCGFDWLTAALLLFSLWWVLTVFQESPGLLDRGVSKVFFLFFLKCIVDSINTIYCMNWDNWVIAVLFFFWIIIVIFCRAFNIQTPSLHHLSTDGQDPVCPHRTNWEVAGMKVSTSAIRWKRVDPPLRIEQEQPPQLEELKYLRILFETEGRLADGLGCEECQFLFYGWIAAGLRHPGGAEMRATLPPWWEETFEMFQGQDAFFPLLLCAEMIKRSKILSSHVAVWELLFRCGFI